MENNKMPKQIPFIKNHYYPGKLLHASDFVREQEYGNEKLAFANRKFHGSGIVDGLEVRMEPSGEWYVTAGSAVDAAGRFLVLAQDTKIDFGRLDGVPPQEGGLFVLGARYAEQVLERERSIFEGEETEQAARVAEGVLFGAYPPCAWRNRKTEAGGYREVLTTERVLYEDGEVRLLLRLPKLVPADSMFRVRLRAEALSGRPASIAWRGTAKLTGAFFAGSGSDRIVLEKSPTAFLGMVEQEWELCTGEGRNLPILLELGPLELLREGTLPERVEMLQVPVETAVSYRLAAEKHLRDGGVLPGMLSDEDDWLPLAYFRTEVTPEGKWRALPVPDDTVRVYAYRPQQEEVLRRAAEENGIVEIRWRSLLKNPTPVLPFAPLIPPQPETPEPALLPAPPPEASEPALQPPEASAPRFQEEWERHVRRGVAVIPVPKRYRKGQVLLSEEIAHGFAGEEVMICCGRLREAGGHIYWERDKKSFYVIQGDEQLFPEQKGSWEIGQQALRQNVAEGSFRIALTLRKGKRRKRPEEVAVSWIAIKSV